MSKLICIRKSVSIDTPNAFSISDRHVGGERSTLVEEGREGGARHPEGVRGRGHRQAQGLDDFGLEEAAWVGGVIHSKACLGHVFALLVVILKVQIDDLFAGDVESDAPVFGDDEAPRAFPVAGHLVGFPHGNCPQLGFALHVLQEGHDLAYLCRGVGR